MSYVVAILSNNSPGLVGTLCTLLCTRIGTVPIPSINICSIPTKNGGLNIGGNVSNSVTNGKDWNWTWGGKIIGTGNVYILS